MKHGIWFKRLIIRNFLAFGANPTEIDLTGNYITAVMGLNHDSGGDESRNGAGKSAIHDAIAYVIFGKTLRGISNAKLTNKMARKGQGMSVVLELDTPDGSYRIERGEAPAKLRLFRKDLDDTNDFLLRDGKTYVYDITKGKGKADTTTDVENMLGFDIKLFEYLIANTSESTPFMKLSEDERRKIAERLLGLNLLAERAEELKEDRKEKRKELVAAESAMTATEQANQRIQRQIDDLEKSERDWDANRKKTMDRLQAQIDKMSSVNVAEQIEILEILDELEQENTRILSERKSLMLELRSANRDLKDLNNQIDESSKRFKTLGEQKRKLDESVCPTCEQHWVPDPQVIKSIEDEIDEISDYSEESVTLVTDAEKVIKDIESQLEALDDEENTLSETATEISDFDLLFDSIKEASEANALVESNKEQLDKIEKEENPHSKTVSSLKQDALQPTDPSELKALQKVVAHYNYLIDLLQSKDSFLRKAVIDRWLPQLNSRIAHYLEILELPFVVRIENDLSMSIRAFGEDFDWGNLSKGQRQRVTIALNLSFQDLFESTNQPLNLLFVDELIDAGLCPRGASQVVQALRETCEKKNKRIFLITHRMDIADQIEDTMLVEHRNKTSFIQEDYDEE